MIVMAFCGIRRMHHAHGAESQIERQCEEKEKSHADPVSYVFAVFESRES